MANAAQIGRELRQKLSEVIRDVMLATSESVEAATPVKTGHLLSNWILATGSPFHGVDGSPAAVSYSAQTNGKAMLADYDIGRDAKIYLTNNVDYAAQFRGRLTQAFLGGAMTAPRGRRARARQMLRGVADVAFRRGA